MSKSSFYVLFTQLVARTIPSNRSICLKLELAPKYAEFLALAQQLKLVTISSSAHCLIVAFTKKGVAVNNKIIRKVGK